MITASDGKESACNAGYPSSIPGSGRSPGEGNGKPLQYSCLGNPTDRGAWEAPVHEVQKVVHDLVTTTTYTLHRLKKISLIKIIKLTKANVY